MSAPYPPWFFARDDDGPDTEFYAAPRFVTHIDDDAIRAVSTLYAELRIGGRVLDLMSSWVSHLPTVPDELVALGLNAAELDANPMASERVVRDLNADPTLPFDDASFDAVLCCVSIDYLTRPVEVLREAGRVLKDEAPLVITFSNRCFPTKAVHAWLVSDDAGRCALVADYIRSAGGFSEPSIERRPTSGDPVFAVTARKR